MIRSKECFKCKAIKPLEDFYKHSQMLDGHVNKCKECNKKDVISNRLENIEKYREYDRERALLPYRVKQRAEINRAWRAEDKRRQRAHSKVSYAIMKGYIFKKPCEKCGNVKSVAHHEDYDKPLEIIWLCQPCHSQRHKQMKEEF